MGSRGRTGQREDARRLKVRYDWLESFSDDELGELVFLRESDPMEPNEEYFDISNPEMGVMSGKEGQRADEGSRYVPKSQVPDHVWEKLVGPFR